MRKTPAILRHVFHPATRDFDSLVRECTLDELRHKFSALKRLNATQLRSLVGSAERLLGPVVNDPAFQVRCAGGVDIDSIVRSRCKLIVEGGDADDDTKRTVLSAIVLMFIDYAKRRKNPYPIIRIRIDEANTARLVGKPELTGIATMRKYGLFFDFSSQGLDYPGGAEAVLNNCKRHEFYGLANHDLARRAAEDLVAGLPPDSRSRAERVAALADDIQSMQPGWRWVFEGGRSWKEYVPMLQNPWPNWGNLRERKLAAKLAKIRARAEYRASAIARSRTTSNPATPPSASSPEDSSPALRLRRAARRQAGGSASSGDANGSP